MKVSIEKPLIILYGKNRQSAIQANEDGFVVDNYGNYAPIENALFSGDLGNQRIGDTLPFDYQLTESE